MASRTKIVARQVIRVLLLLVFLRFAVIPAFAWLPNRFPAAYDHITAGLILLLPSLVIGVILYHGVRSILAFQQGLLTAKSEKAERTSGKPTQRVTWLFVGALWLMLLARLLSFAFELNFFLMLLLTIGGAVTLVLVVLVVAQDFESRGCRVGQLSVLSLLLIPVGVSIFLAPIAAVIRKIQDQGEIDWFATLVMCAFAFIIVGISCVVLLAVMDALFCYGIRITRWIHQRKCGMTEEKHD
jgi:uncharacterized membrane protein (DUF373 family)